MIWLPIINFYSLRIGAANIDAGGDFIDNQVPGLYVFVAECGEDQSHVVVSMPGLDNLVYEGELFGVVARDVAGKLQTRNIPSDVVYGLLKSGYEQDMDGLIDVDQQYAESAFNACESDSVSNFSPCYFVVVSVTNDLEDVFIDLRSDRVEFESEALGGLNELYGRINESASWVTGIPA